MGCGWRSSPTRPHKVVLHEQPAQVHTDNGTAARCSRQGVEVERTGQQNNCRGSLRLTLYKAESLDLPSSSLFYSKQVDLSISGSSTVIVSDSVDDCRTATNLIAGLNFLERSTRFNRKQRAVHKSSDFPLCSVDPRLPQ